MLDLDTVAHLIEDFLQVRGAHAVSQVSVGGMGEEELPLGAHSSIDVLLPVNVLLAPVHHTDVTWTQKRPWRCLYDIYDSVFSDFKSTRVLLL